MINGMRSIALVDPRIGLRALAQAVDIAQTCIKSGSFTQEDCNLKHNTIFIGDSTPRHREIVTTAITWGAPMILTRREPPRPRGWLKCVGSVKYDGLDCDEYPYAASHEGGPFGLTFTALNTPMDNQGAGRVLGAMLGSCGVRGNAVQGDPYSVFPIPEGGHVPTMFVCSGKR
jgi:hypothetical protein